MKSLISKKDSTDNQAPTAIQPVNRVQPKLTAGAPGDKHEQEADAVADKVMRMPEQNFVQRKCDHCEEEEEKQLQRKPLSENITPLVQAKSEGGASVSNSLSNKISSSQGSGSSMDSNTQSFMSSRFGTDFTDVKIHTDGEAVQMSRELNAKAFTVGNDIYFNEGQYQPGSDSGKQLLAHELTHTVQQGRDNSKVQRAVWVCDEWSQSASGSYSPGPGITFAWSANNITITANFELYGSAASATLASQMKSTIESYWTGAFGAYTVNTTVNITVRASGASAASNRTLINCISSTGVSEVMPYYWIVGSRMMNYYTSSDINWTPAHEFGHLLGLGDRYSENWFTQIFGADRTSTPDSGWAGNIMAEHGGTVQERNIGELMGRYASVCTRSHLESPL